MIDLAWAGAAVLLWAGLLIGWAVDLRAQNARCRARNARPLRVYTMNLPDSPTIHYGKAK